MTNHTNAPMRTSAKKVLNVALVSVGTVATSIMLLRAGQNDATLGGASMMALNTAGAFVFSYMTAGDLLKVVGKKNISAFGSALKERLGNAPNELADSRLWASVTVGLTALSALAVTLSASSSATLQPSLYVANLLGASAGLVAAQAFIMALKSPSVPADEPPATPTRRPSPR